MVPYDINNSGLNCVVIVEAFYNDQLIIFKNIQSSNLDDTYKFKVGEIGLTRFI